MLFYLFVTSLIFDLSQGIYRQLLEVTSSPRDSTFVLEGNSLQNNVSGIYISTASNTDVYDWRTKIGIFGRYISFRGTKLEEQSPHLITVHLFNHEVEEASKALHFLCHSLNSKRDDFKRTTISKIPLTACCLISVNTTFSELFASCILKFHLNTSISTCHTTISLPSVLWKQAFLPTISLSYSTFYLPYDGSYQDSAHQQCVVHTTVSPRTFTHLTSATIVKSVPDAIREIGGSLLLQVPRRELGANEEFTVPVRLKRGNEVSDFTIRCEVPANSFVEFVRVIWPGGISTWKNSETDLLSTRSSSSGTSTTNTQSGQPNLWDIFHRNIMSQKRNITEIVARLREDLVKTESNIKQSSSTEVFKLLFRVTRPPEGTSGRVAPRIFWSLVSVSRHRTPDRTINDSPIVTRLNIESSELSHLTMVIKTSALVNLAPLTGRPSVHPVWVYGLTHDGNLVDVTERATCHTGDDAVIHFANDACHRLSFSGLELDGSPGLPLVAKLDGRSASETLLVWFPKPPAIRLVVDQSSMISVTSDSLDRIPVILRRLTTSSKFSYSKTSSDVANYSTDPVRHFQHLPVRVLARFILAGSVLYDKDVLGGKVDQYVDVTDYTAHRLRVQLVSPDERTKADVFQLENKWRPLPVQMIPLGHRKSQNSESNRVMLDAVDLNERSWYDNQSPVSVWLVGQYPGVARIQLEPIDQSVVASSIPPGLEKQIKDQLSQSAPHNTSQGMNIRVDQPSIDVHVTDESNVWPIGVSAQLVTGFTLEVYHSVDSSQQREMPPTRDTFNTISLEHSTEDPMPLYSGVYSIWPDILGGPLVHIGTAPDAFTSTTDKTQNRQFMPLRHVLQRHGLFERILSEDLESDTSILISWIHLSDGTTTLWNRMIEIYRSMGRPLPFRLLVNNLRPDIFDVVETTADNRGRRRRQAVKHHFSRHTGSFDYPSERSFVAINRNVKNSERQQSDDASTTGSLSHIWTGPLIKTIQKSLSFSGDILELSLVSPNGNSLFPKLKVPLNLTLPLKTEKAQTARKVFPYKTDTSLESQRSIYGSRSGQTSSDHSSRSQPLFNRTTDVPLKLMPLFPPSYEQMPTSDMQSGILALKDAPRGKGHLSNLKHVNENGEETNSYGFLHETSLSDQTREEKVLNSIDSASKVDDSQHDITEIRGARPVLELSMCILLGLFALVGLVFAVNCGAVVARYRWERVGQLRRASQAVVPQSDVTDQFDGGQWRRDKSERIGKTVTEEAAGKPNSADKEAPKLLKTVKNLLMMGCPKDTQSLFHKDNNWVWVSRDKVAKGPVGRENLTITTSPVCNRLPDSPLFTDVVTEASAKDTAIHTYGRSFSYGDGQTKTRAVLSVGEADMFLMQSPYYQGVWQDGVNTVLGGPSEYSAHHAASPNTDRLALLHSALGGPDQWNDRSFRRPTRRHTTSALMQRNYQGYECSIRIITNPHSQTVATTVTDRIPHQERALDGSDPVFTLNTLCAIDQQGKPESSGVYMGSASVSMRRRQRSVIHNFVQPNKLSVNHELFQIQPTSTFLQIPTNSTRDASTNSESWDGASRYMNAIMYRSWVRPGTHILQSTYGQQYTENQPDMSYCLPSLNNADPQTTATDAAAVHPKSTRIHHNRRVHTTGDDPAIWSVLSLAGSDRKGSTEIDSDAPCPPVRTTSRALALQQNESPDHQTRKPCFIPSQRPMSLPQNFQANNDLYSMPPHNTDSTEVSILMDSQSPNTECDDQTNILRRSDMAEQSLNSSPSEESLWWYHPIRQQNRTKRHQATKHKPNKLLTPTSECCQTDRSENCYPNCSVPDESISRETLEYSCPISCNCEIYNSNMADLYPIDETSHLNPSAVTSTSELAWGSELLTLSDDRLVAYFADMKESMA